MIRADHSDGYWISGGPKSSRINMARRGFEGCRAGNLMQHRPRLTEDQLGVTAVFIVRHRGHMQYMFAWGAHGLSAD